MNSPVSNDILDDNRDDIVGQPRQAEHDHHRRQNHRRPSGLCKNSMPSSSLSIPIDQLSSLLRHSINFFYFRQVSPIPFLQSHSCLGEGRRMAEHSPVHGNKRPSCVALPTKSLFFLVRPHNSGLSHESMYFLPSFERALHSTVPTPILSDVCALT